MLWATHSNQMLRVAHFSYLYRTGDAASAAMGRVRVRVHALSRTRGPKRRTSAVPSEAPRAGSALQPAAPTVVGVAQREYAAAVALELVSGALLLARAAVAKQVGAADIATAAAVVRVAERVGACGPALCLAGITRAASVEAIGAADTGLTAAAAMSLVTRRVDARATTVRQRTAVACT